MTNMWCQLCGSPDATLAIWRH